MPPADASGNFQRGGRDEDERENILFQANFTRFLIVSLMPDSGLDE
jgi:hypothetical protein